MTCTDSHVERQRQFLSRYDLLLCRAYGSVPEGSLPLIAEALVRNLSFSPANGVTVMNLKGRDASSPCLPEVTKNLASLPQELIGIAGTVRLPQPKELKARQLAELPFEYQVFSQFDAFPGAHDIQFRLSENRPQIFPDWYTPLHCTRALPIALSAMRVGFELFESRFTSMSFGYAPVVTSHVLVEVSLESWCVKLQTELLRRESTVHVLSHPILERFNESLEALLNWSMSSSFQAQR